MHICSIDFLKQLSKQNKLGKKWFFYYWQLSNTISVILPQCMPERNWCMIGSSHVQLRLHERLLLIIWNCACNPRFFISFHSFHFSLSNHGSLVNLLRLLCRGPCKKLHNQKSKTYFTIILTEITEIKIFLTEIKQVQ